MMDRAGRHVGRWAVAILASAAIVAVVPSTSAAQELPTAGEVEEDSGDEESESEGGETEGDEEEGTDREAAESGAESTGDEQAAQADSESGELEGEAGASGEGSETEGSEMEGEEPTDGSQSEESTAAASGEGAGDDGSPEAAEAEDGERGEIVETTTDVEREVTGRGATEGDARWVQSGVNAYGVPGFQHIASAAPSRRNTYDISFFGEVTTGEDIIRAGDDNTFVGGRLNVHAQPIEYFSANVSVGATNNANDFGRPETILSQGDLSVGVRGHYPVRKYLDLALDTTVEFPTGFDSTGVDPSATGVRPRLLGSFHLDPLVPNQSVPLTTHVNAGFQLDNTTETVPDGVNLTRVERFAHDISDYDFVALGVGAQYDLPFVSPFVSWNLDIPVNGPNDICRRPGPECVESAGFETFPNVISFGLQGEPVDQFAIHAGADVSLTSSQSVGLPATPPWKIIVGANWKIDPRAKVERVTKTVEKTRLVKGMPERGHLVGTVVDQKSGEPVGGAQIEYVGTERAPQVSGAETGEFRSYGFEPETELTVRISHPNYHDTEMTKTLAKGDQEQTIELEPKPQTGVVEGKITDEDGEPIAGATVRLAGPELTEVTTDSSGSFRVDVKAGKYGLGATSDNHLAANQTVDVPAGNSVSIELALEEGGNPSMVTVEEDRVKVEEKIHFETGTSTLSRNSNVILDQVASTLKSHPELVKIEIAGHTDDVGSKEDNMELSRERAQAVYDYLTSEGVRSDRLATKGYGPTEPLVPNISDENRSLNRRVEFRIRERQSGEN